MSMKLRGSKGAVLCLSAGALTAAIALPIGLDAGSNPTAASANELPTTRAQATKDMASAWPQFQGEMQQVTPAPRLTAAQASAWTVAWDSMAACMHAHGVATFPGAPATFGNGKVHLPVVGGPIGSAMAATNPTMETASKACPFEPTGVDQAAFQQAVEAWSGAHPGVPAQDQPAQPPGVSVTASHG
ncbi:MAG: hypothetical protein ACRDY3_00530 [Acidimicrobiales bacterium]